MKSVELLWKIEIIITTTIILGILRMISVQRLHGHRSPPLQVNYRKYILFLKPYLRCRRLITVWSWTELAVGRTARTKEAICSSGLSVLVRCRIRCSRASECRVDNFGLTPDGQKWFIDLNKQALRQAGRPKLRPTADSDHVFLIVSKQSEIHSNNFSIGRFRVPLDI